MRFDPFPRFFPLDRAVPLSDAVFAVVMTLLVLGIEVPSESGLSGAALDATNGPSLRCSLSRIWSSRWFFIRCGG